MSEKSNSFCRCFAFCFTLFTSMSQAQLSPLDPQLLGSAQQAPRIARDQNGAPQFIVKFKSAQSLDTNMATLNTGLSTPQQAKQLAESLRKQALQRVTDLSAASGKSVKFKRMLGSGADLVSVAGTDSDEIQANLAALRANPAVEYAEPDYYMQALFTPNDEFYDGSSAAQWHYFESTGGLNLPLAWDISTGLGAVVAVLDTGYVPHEDLSGNLIGGYDFISDTFVARDGDGRDPDALDEGDWTLANECAAGFPATDSSWHGTHVAGTIAALTDNGTGVAGVAFNASVVPVRVLGRCGGLTSDIADAVAWASGASIPGIPNNPNPADVINMSLGGGGSCSAAMQSAINTAVANNTVVVIAAGNSDQNASQFSPANCNNVITVAATNQAGGKSYYSNFGAIVDVAAPGGEMFSGQLEGGVLSTMNSGTTTAASDTYAFSQGTSMAAPHVAGVAALLKSQDASLTPAAIESRLKNSARGFPSTCSGCGTGIVDALAALDEDSVPEEGGDVEPGGFTETGLAVNRNDWAYFTIEVPAGATSLTATISGGTGDADLYVNFGSEPTASSYSCRPYLNGNSETCELSSPAAGTWHIGVNAYRSFSGVNLSVSYN